MSTIVTRAGKGSPLTNTEVDNNFSNLNDDKVEKSGDTLTGDLAFGDNVKAKFGASDDLEIYHDGSTSYIKDAGTGNLDISTNGSAIRLVQGNGNRLVTAGYGTAGVKLWYGSDDTEKLATTSTGIDVTGTVTADGLTVDGDVLLDKTATGANKVLINASSGNNSRLVFCEGPSAGEKYNIGFQSSDASFNVYHSAGSANRLKLQNNGDISFYNDAGTSQDLYWDASTSRLGLGTTSPSTDVHIKGAGGTFLRLEAGNGTSFTDISQNQANSRLDIKPDGTTYLSVNNNGDISFYDDSSSSQDFYWDASTSRLGLGTTSPSQRLHLDYGSNILTGSGEVAMKMTVLSSFVSAQNEIRSGVTSGTNPYMSFAVREATSPFATVERMRIDSSGNVGINTTAPGDKLDISAGNINLSNGYSLAWGGSTGRPYISGDKTSQFVAVGTNGSERMRIDSSGNVGIGTTSPATKLQIDDSSDFSVALSKRASTASAIKFTLSDPTVTTNTWKLEHDASENLNIYGYSSDALIISTNATERLRIASNGRVGIGTTSPDSLLHIKTTSPTLTIQDSTTSFALINSKIVTTGSDGSGNPRTDVRYLIGSDGNAFTISYGATPTERMRIDSSGRLGIGTTSPVSPLQVDRASTDGAIVTLSKDGTTVGSIGVSSSDLLIDGQSDRTGLAFRQFGEITPRRNGALANGTADLGSPSYRFRNLYLSGGVYLGGTGSANLLDDYEEGTWTPTATVNGFNQTISSLAGEYTKIGQSVTVTCKITLSTAGYASSYSQIGTLPFTPSVNSTGAYSSGTLSGNGRGDNAVVLSANTNLWLHEDSGTQTSGVWFATVTYFTDS